MTHLMFSRNSRDTTPTKLQNLSPQKFGKAAYADLCYTPSKLAENVLYRQVTTLRKVEEGSSKVREFESMNSFLKERLAQLEQERDGIQQSLTQQIVMYKKMLHDMELKHQARLIEIQKKFTQEIKIIIDQKEQEAKYAQSEKELLQNKIEELEAEIKALQERLNHAGNMHQDVTNELKKLETEYRFLNQKFVTSQHQRRIDNEKSKESYDELSKRYSQAEISWKIDLQNVIAEKQKERMHVERTLRTQIEKLDNQRMNENVRKSQELKELSYTFESEAKRLNDLISMKDRMIQTLNRENSKEKEAIIQITNHYQNQLNGSLKQKLYLNQQLQFLVNENKSLKDHLSIEERKFMTQTSDMKECIDKLKEDLQYNQINFVRERDRYEFCSSDFEREIIRLRAQSCKYGEIFNENQRLNKQIRSLRDLLMESSYQIDKCKEQLSRIGFERDQFAGKIQKLAHENQALYRIKRDYQQQATKWRNSFYLNRLHI